MIVTFHLIFFRPALSEGIESNNVKDDVALYEDVIQDGDEMALIGGPPPLSAQAHMQRSPTPLPPTPQDFPHNYHEEDDIDSEESLADLLARPFGVDI